ncbi:MAG TPA: hypothetical protein VIY29_18870 [Ktedonobacteraceae bacterium]
MQLAVPTPRAGELDEAEGMAWLQVVTDEDRPALLQPVGAGDRRAYHTLGKFLRAAQGWFTFYNQLRPHEGLGNLSPERYAQQHARELTSSSL